MLCGKCAVLDDMTITSLHINNFRNLTSVQIKPVHHGLNIITGNNGSGKTSILEAIFYLGHGKSFRSSIANRMINHHADKFSLYTQVLTSRDRIVPLGVEREQSGAARLRIDENDVSSMAELASHLPIRMIHSQSHQLFEAGPAFRRKYLDWGLFYYDPSFMTCWRQYERVLKQRNSILRDKRSKSELETWTNELVKYGIELDKLRNSYIATLLPHICEFVMELLGISDLEMDYQNGWSRNSDFESVLRETTYEDYRVGHTQAGPHRADFDLLVNGLVLRHNLSRGQQKLLICAMILAQGKMLAEQDNAGLIYLVDDLPSELDVLSRQKLVSLFAKQKSQIFITAIEQDSICGLIRDEAAAPVKVFHVEHGNVADLIEIMV